MRKQFSKWISLFLAAGMVMTTPASVMAEDVISGSEPVTVTGSSDAGSPTEEAEQTREKGKTEVVAKDASKDGKKEETEPTADETADEAEKEAVSLPSEYTDGTADLSGIDFSSKRLIVGTEDAAVTENDPDVVEALDGMYLIQYATEQEAQNAYQYYTEHADFVEVDTGIKSADNTANSDDEDAPKTDGTEDAAIVTDPMTEEENPFTELIEEEETAKSIETYQGKQAYDIALIDTGASEYTDNGVSMIGSNTDDENGHGTKMAQIIKEEDPDTAILSVKALDKDGIGTVSSVYAAIEYAISQDVKIINLSLSGVAKADSRSIEDAVNEAVDAGIVVVGAAGNDGKNVKYYIPGKINSAVIVGACDKNGNRLETSNYGDTVDYYVTAGSTSEAAARFSGLLAKNGFAVDDAAKADGVFTADGLSLHTENKGETEEEKGETKLSAADTVTATSGTWGTCPWSFDTTTGALTIGAGTGERGSNSSLGSDYPWYNFRTKITNINLTGAVHLPVNSSWLFRDCTSLTSIVNCVNLDTSKVTNMYAMFYDCSSLTSLNVSKFNTSKVTDMRFMFNKCGALTSLDVSSFDTSKVTNMSSMFDSCSSLTNLNVSKFNTSNVTNMSFMFNNCSALTSLDISSFDTSNVTNMYAMFQNCSSLTSLNVSKFNTSKVTDMSFMFNKCGALTSLDVSSFDTSNVTNMLAMFQNCSALTSLDISSFNTSNVTNMCAMFQNCSALTSLNVSKFNTSKVTDMRFMFKQCGALTSLDVSSFDTSKVTNMSGMFDSCSALTSLNVSKFNTSNVTDMSFMFNKCSALTSLDVSNFDTSNVTNMLAMFQNCSSLTSLNVSKFNTSKVTDMSFMFYGCSVLAGLDVSHFNTSNVTNMSGMFNSCSSLTSLNVSKFNTSKVTDMSFMFYGCSVLTGLDLSKFDTSNVTNMRSMFNNCTSLTSLDLSKFDTSNVTNMRSMFNNCTSLTSLDVSSFDTSNVTNMDAMLANNTSLSKITIGPNFVIPANNNNDLFPTSIAKTYSGQLTNNKWGLGSENATSSYSGDDLIKLGQTKGKLAGTWYAQAAKKYTLTYNGNGGTPSTASATGYETKTWGTLASATRTGYTFQGWYTAASGGTQVTSSTPCTTSLTVYAHWKANSYTISFDANGGSGTTASVSATYDGNMPSITNGISRSGYTFTGFYDAKTGGTKYYNADGSSARTWNKAANKTLYAQWTLTPYKFDVNPQSHVTGFRLKKNDADADNGTTIGDYYADAHMEDVFYLYSPTFATGYEFSSFTKQYGPGSQSTSGSTATITMGAGAQAIAINAKPITYTISYNLNGGSVGGNPSSYNIESAAFTLKNPTRPGYTFKGWTGSNGSTPQTSVAVSKGSTGNRSYTANWAANTNTKYTVIHQQEQLDGTYQTVETQNLTGVTDTKVTPAVKSYVGFTSPTTQTVNIAGAGNTVVTYKYVRNTYTITRQFRLENADGTFTGYTQIDSNKYKYGASIASWNRPADTTYKAAAIAAYTVTAKNATLSVNVMRNTSTNNAIQYRLQNADGSYPTTYTTAWSGTLRYGESHTWNYAQTASHQAASKSVSYNGGTVKVDVSRRTGRLVIHANGGTGDRATTAILYGASDKISPMPTRTGYTLTGLYTATSGGTKVVNADGTMTNDGTYSKNGAWLLNSDINVYAQWKANTYTISYTMNGGTNSSSNPTSYNVTSAAITLTAPTKSGWTFTGWSGTGLTGSANKTVTIAAGSTGNRTYTAHWSKTITLTQMQGGTAKTTQTYTMTDSETSHTFTLPSTSTQSYSGWTFDGWLNAATPKAHDYAPGASLAISDNKTVYATFKQTQTLTFIDYNGTTKRTQIVTGTAYGNSSAGGVGNQYPKLTAPAEGTYTGWSARGWSASTASNGSVSVASGGSISNAKTGTYYGLYQQGVTLTYAANGGSSTPSTQNGTRYVNSYAITTYTNPTFALASAISRTGYAFTGWSVSAPISGTKAAGSSITPASGTALTATAQWSLTTYTITYNLNGGTNSSSNPSSYNMTSNAITLAAPTRTGYTFTGWTGSNGTTAQKTVTIASGSTGNKSYTAHWTANSYTIAFNANGGSGTMTNESMTYDTAKTLTANNFTRTGYTFAGWNTKADGSGTSYANGATVKNLAAGGTVTLYAQWKPNTYTNNISHWTWGYKNQEGNSGNKAAFQLGSTDFTETYGTSYTVGTDRGLALPNGFTLQNTFGTSAISGSWTQYAMGTSVTQKAETMHYEYDYDPITYTITYAMNGGTNSSANPSSYNVLYGVTFASPTRSGYTFTGWTMDGKTVTGINPGANASFTSADDLYTKLASRTTGNKKVIANWTANTNTKYTVIHQQEQLDGTYKTVDTQNLTGTTDTSVTPAVKSYTGFTAPSTQTITIKGDGTASVTYKYTRNSYTVTRQYRLQNADGSYNSYMQIDSKSYKYGTSIAAWTRSADDTYKAASIAVHTVAAKNETLSVNVDRKTASVALQYRLQNADGTYPTSFTSGWTGTLRVGENHTWAYTQTTSHSAVSKTVTYGDGTVSVDVPRRTGRLVIKANGGSSDRTTAAIRYGSTSDTISPLPTRTGYTLTGLYTTATGGTKVVNASGTMANDGTYSTDGTWLLNSDVTVYAQWTVNTYKISYTLNGGTNASGNPSSYTIESDAISLAAPTRTGYTFTGWTGSNGTTAQTSVTIAKGSTGDKNYTANWKANSYTVKFDANGGTGTITDEDFTYDQSKALSANTFKRKFYTFAGWNIKKDGSGTQYADLASAKNLATSGDVTLYAQWTANTYTVSIPTAINYKNMQTGAVSTSNSYDITVKNQTGSFGDTVKVQAANGELNAANGSSDKLTATAGSSSSPLPFTEDGSKQDSISITGTTHTADKWTGSVQYSVTIE